MAERSGSTGDSLDALLRAGIAAAQAGRREQARDLLAQLVQQDDKNVTAWLWLSGVVDDLANREVCLQHVLRLDPDNEAARRGLARVREQNLKDLLREGIAAAKLGQRDHARMLLTSYVEQDDQNVTAWLWLSSVASGPEDQEICLENVLTLDPDNEAARSGLAEGREQREIVAAATAGASAVVLTPLTPATVQPDTTEAAAVETSAEQWVFTPPSDDLFLEYNCPYCAARAEREQKKCASCGRSLWIRKRKREERSTWFWIALTIEIGNTAINLGLLVILFMAIGFLSEVHGIDKLLRIYFGLTGGIDAADVEEVLNIAPRLLVIPILLLVLFSLAVIVAMFLRWKPAWSLYMLGAVWGLVQAAASLLLGLAQVGGTALICGGLNVLIAFFMLWVAFQMQDDFFFDYTRMLMLPDRDATGGLDFLAHGSRYARKGMWGMAALHFQRAAGLLSNQIQPHLALATAMIQLKQYDRAEGALAQARQVNASDPGIAEVSEMLARAERATPA